MLMTGVLGGAAPNNFAGMITALGTEAFEGETLRFLHDSTGAEHYSVYRVRDDKPEFLGGASIRGAHAVRHGRWSMSKRPRTYSDLQAVRKTLAATDSAVLVHDDIAALDDLVLRMALLHFDIVDRVMVCGRSCADVYAISLLRSDRSGQFDAAELARLAGAAETLVAAFAKHATMHWDRVKTITGFRSAEVIEKKLAQQNWGLSERERQVAARILYGISAVGIASDLDLSEDTIATYRKRLYQRLQIGSRHELFQMYLATL